MEKALTALNAQVRALILGSAADVLRPEPLRQAVLAYPSRGGKGLRPALLAWTCGVFSGSAAAAMHVAAAVELYHTWTLVHDDIIDCDDFRRGQPTAHRLVADEARSNTDGLGAEAARRFGIDMAILAGDVQQAWANALILQAVRHGVPASIGLTILERLNQVVTPGLLSGEAMDVAFELRPFATISTADIEAMLTLKTGLLLRFAAEAGAMIGLGTADVAREEVVGVGDMAELAGLAFQLHDDVLGMFGDEAVVGKPVGSDLRQGKRTVLFAEAAARASADDAAFLLRALGHPDISQTEMARVQRILRDSGALAAVEGQATAALDRARGRWRTLPDNRYRTLLGQWLDYVTARRY